MEYFSAFLGRSCFWVRRACGCVRAAPPPLCICIWICIFRYFLLWNTCVTVCSSLHLAGQPSFVQSEAGVRQAGRCSADNDPPTKRCCKAIFIFWQQQISIKVVLGNIHGLVAHHLWGKHPIKSNLYSFYGMQLFIACHNHVIFGPKIWETLKAYIFNISGIWDVVMHLLNGDQNWGCILGKPRASLKQQWYQCLANILKSRKVSPK